MWQSNPLAQGGEEWSEKTPEPLPSPHGSPVSSPLQDIEDTDGQIAECKDQQNHH